MWLEHMLSSLSGTKGKNRVVVDYDLLMRSPADELGRIAKKFPLTLDQVALDQFISSFLDHKLQHSVFSLHELLEQKTCHRLVADVYETLLGLADDSLLDDEKITEKVKNWRKAYNEMDVLIRLTDQLCTKTKNLEQQRTELSQVALQYKHLVSELRSKQIDTDKLISRYKRDVADREARLASSQDVISNLEKRVAFDRIDEKNGKDDKLEIYKGGNIRQIGRIFQNITKKSAFTYYRFLKKVKESKLFDEAWYARQYPDVELNKFDPLKHYFLYGSKEGRNPNPYFDTKWYLSTYPDVEKSNINPLYHYIVFGAKEFRKPNRYFAIYWYLNQYQDVAASKMDPLLHYIKYGESEGRCPNPYFFPLWYLKEYPDVLNSGLGPLAHFLIIGEHEGRNPNPYFITKWYLEEYPDVEGSNYRPLEHYFTIGDHEGKCPNPYFLSDWYLKEYSDIDEKGLNGFLHFCILEQAKVEDLDHFLI